MVQLSNNIFIEADNMSYMLRKRFKTEKGEERIETLGYYPTMEMTLKGYLKLKGREYVGKAEINTINEFLEYMKEQDKKLKKIMEGN